MFSRKPTTYARRAEPHKVTLVNGQTWGQRMSNKQKFKKSVMPNPIEYFNQQTMEHAKTTEEMQKVREGMEEHAQGKTYYMNTPADSRFKMQLHELGKYQRPMIDGMYNQHENLQEGAAQLMEKRLRYGMV